MTTRLRRYNQKDLPLSQQTNSVLIPDGVITEDYISVPLAGLDSYGYEVSLQEALLWLQESFSGSTPPAKAIKGQLWFNTSNNLIYAYNGDDFSNGGDSTNINNWVIPSDITYDDLSNHLSDFNNPHNVTKAQIGLSNVVDQLQLVAANNLSDLDNVATARNNLDVHSKSHIDSNFSTISGTNIAIDTALNNTTLFLKSTSNNAYSYQFTLSNTSPILFTDVSGSTPLSIYGNNVRFTVNDDNRDFNLKSGVDCSPGTNTGDKFLTTGDGATLLAFNFKGKDGSIVLGARNANTQGVNLDFDNVVELTQETFKWVGFDVVTTAGAAMKGNIVADTSGLRIGGSSPVEKFEEMHAEYGYYDKIVTSEITHTGSLNDVGFNTSSNIAFKNGDDKIYYVTFDTLKNNIKTSVGNATTSDAGIAKIAPLSDLNNPNTSNVNDIVTPKTYVDSLPSCKAWVSFSGFGTGAMAINASYNISSVVRQDKGIYAITFVRALKDGYCVFCNNTSGRGGTNGTLYSTGSDAWKNPPVKDTNGFTVVFGNGDEERDVYEANIIVYGEFAN